MSTINNVYMPNFSPEEFPEDPNVYADQSLLSRLQQYRRRLDEKIYPSKEPGGLARLSGSEKSLHYVDIAEERLSGAIDVFPVCDPFKAWTVALSSNLWGGVGIYFDTNGNNGKPWVMLHLDIRTSPLIWYRDNFVKHYPWEEDFYTNLFELFRQATKP